MVYVEADTTTLRLSRETGRSIDSLLCVTIGQHGRVGGQEIKPCLRETKHTTVTVIPSRLNQINKFVKLIPQRTYISNDEIFCFELLVYLDQSL